MCCPRAIKESVLTLLLQRYRLKKIMIWCNWEINFVDDLENRFLQLEPMEFMEEELATSTYVSLMFETL